MKYKKCTHCKRVIYQGKRSAKEFEELKYCSLKCVAQHKSLLIKQRDAQPVHSAKAEQISHKFLYTYKPANAVCGEAG